MTTAPPGPILVIGIGNVNRGDDAIGPLVARQIKSSAPPGVSVVECDGDSLSMAELWKDASAVFAIDAAEGASALGTVHRFDAAAAPIPARTFRQSTHAFGLAEAIELSRALKQLPGTFIVYAISSRHFAIDASPSSAATDAAPSAAGQILAELAVLCGRWPDHDVGAAASFTTDPRPRRQSPR